MGDFWFQRDSYKDFHAELLKDINEVSSVTWENSSYHNDASGSVCYYHHTDDETYVQLFAFETKFEAELELGEEYGTIYSITVCVKGNSNYTCWDGDSRSEALHRAAYFALKMYEGDTTQ